MTFKVGVENLKFDLKSVDLRCKPHLYLFYYHPVKSVTHQPRLANRWIISFIENGKLADFSDKQKRFKINIHFKRSELPQFMISKSNFIEIKIIEAFLGFLRNI